MLEDALFESRDRKKTRRPLTVLVSVVIHIWILSVLVLIPLLQIQAVPLPTIDMSLWAPKTKPESVVEVVATKPPRVQTKVEVDSNAVVAPESIPKGIAMVVDPPETAITGFPPAAGDEGARSILREFIRRQPEVDPTPPPQPPALPPGPKVEPVRRGGNVQQANLIHQVRPIYPPLAKQARVQGVVVLEAVITKEGAIESLRVISGHPLLTQAAIDAVQQWGYRPTLLNGEPVPVITTITVSFALQ